MSTIPDAPHEAIPEPHVRDARGTPQVMRIEDDDPRDGPAAATPALQFIMELQGQVQAIITAAMQKRIHSSKSASKSVLRPNHRSSTCEILTWPDGDAGRSGLHCQSTRLWSQRRNGEAEALRRGAELDEGRRRCRGCGRGVQAAIEAAAILHHHPQALPAACGRIAQQLADLGVIGYTAHRLQQRAEGLAASGGAQKAELSRPR